MNRSKCKVMRFYGPVLDETSRYEIDGTEIDFTDNYKDLGILVSNTLDWSKHYSTICSKAYGAINLIRRTITTNNTQTKKNLYFALVHSHLTYCTQLWRPLLFKNISKLERIQSLEEQRTTFSGITPTVINRG